jgi:hypothetical protein
MTTRGSYLFEIGGEGRLVDNAQNLEKLRALFRDGGLIGGQWGPGNEGDFDNGSWHILCHLAAGSGVLQTSSGGRAWCSITHVRPSDTYLATITYRVSDAVWKKPLASPESRSLAAGAACLGFVEGSSQGHLMARGVIDPPDAFNGWPRQQFDQDVTSDADGGTVWEHWSTTRDIRPSSAIGTSVLVAYLTLVSVLGGRFVAAVARGRREHEHPRQLVGLVKAGLLTADEATWDIRPRPIDAAAERLLCEAHPPDALKAVESLPFSWGWRRYFMFGRQRYFMFQRRIGRWSTTTAVRQDLGL